MDITFAKCEQILNTLPIGYYTGRRVGISLKDDIPTSYYCPPDDEITISYPIIREGVNKITETDDIEGVVRSMMYHEVSHAILTPERLEPSARQRDVVNIFEDERIETVLRNFYHGVNFRKQVYDLNGGIHKPKDSIGAFFNAVRFGIAPPKYLDKINKLLSKFASMNRNADYYECSSYTYAIWSLYNEIEEEFKNNPDAFAPHAKEGEGQEGEGQDSRFAKLVKADEQEAENSDSTKLVEVIRDSEHDMAHTLEEIQDMISAGMDIKSRLGQGQKQELYELQKTVETIISNFNKKNTGGSGINTYSGVFNPRAIARGDYRYFERSSSIQGNNKFGTCHLNLFVDCSGSFYESEDLINGILEVLSSVERKNRNFTIDVIFCGVGAYICKNKHERRIKCDGGNNLPNDMKEIFLSMQKQNTCNYNIVLFDGDAFSDYYDSDRTKHGIKVFGAFDYKQTTVITDYDNERYLGNGFTNAKVVVTSNYTNELIKHITKALTIAFS